MRLSARSRPVAWLTVLLSTATLAATFPIAGADPARALSRLDGQLLVALGRSGSGDTSRVQLSLRTGSGIVRLHVPESERANVYDLAGRSVRVQGRRTRAGFAAVSLEPANGVTAEARHRSSPGTMRVAVVLMHLPGSRDEGVTRRAAAARFFSRRRGPSSVAQWFAEVSGGQTEVRGRVFGYYDARLPADDCRLADWLKAAGEAAARDGYSADRYTHLVVYTPRQHCAFAGISHIGASGAYLNGRLRQTVAAHELGHNLGLRDAGAYSCRPTRTTCLRERGDPVDIMGNVSANRHFSAVHKHMLGWIPKSHVRTVRSGTATIALTAGERPAAGKATQLILVPRGNGTSYAIDRRESFGHDHGLSGVWVRIVDRVGSTDTALPIATALAPGKSFVDAAGGITIKTLSDSGPTASVQVCVGPCANGGSPPVKPPAPTTVGAAASREVMWSTCSEVVSLTDAQLDMWRSRGIGGFVCQIQDITGKQFSADPHASLAGQRYEVQRQIRDSKIVARAAARGMRLWLGFYLSTYYNHATPFKEWFDDAAWSTEVLPNLGDLAGAARTLGFAGLAFDEEQYNGGTWEWSYPGNTHREAEVRAKVRARGVQVMRTVVDAFPGVDLIDYGTYFPDGWNALLQRGVNHAQDPYASSVQINFWDGLTSVPGYGPIRFMDATFYKTAGFSGATWDNALTYNVNRLMAYFSRHLTNWTYASSRINVSPFAWIEGGHKDRAFDAARPPAYVFDQLAAFRRWGMGGAFAIYAYNGVDSKFDYGPYVTAMQAAARPDTIDNQPPSLTITNTQRQGDTVTVSGTATDNMAIRSILWRAGTNTGSAKLTWTVTDGAYYSRYHWRMDWTATVTAPPGQTMTFTVRDIKNNAARSVDAAASG